VSLLPPRPSPLTPGFKLDRYELLCPIAEGGMASVWIARHTGKHGFEKFVAIKTVLPKFAADARFQQMFQDEARIASRIEHANVAQVLDVGEQHDITFLVMEYVDGESLSTVHRTLAKKGMRIPPGVVLRVMADVCGGLHAAHELREEDGQLLGVVHRDVSPQNVLVSAKGIAKLIDFGIAKARDRLAADTNAGQVKGKIRYMAPEQALGGAIDHRADLWAVGAILYHLLSGKPPYDGDNDVQALMVLTSGRPPVPLAAEVHPAIAAVVMRALASSVEGRLSSAAEMQQALEDAIVDAQVATSTAAVSAFLAEHVADRARKRKEAIAIGVKAAAERERYAKIMRSHVKVTAGGTGTALDAGFNEATLGTGASSATRIGSDPEIGSRSGVGSSPGMASPGSSNPVPSSARSNSVVTGGTLGSAAMDVGGVAAPRGRTVAVAGVTAGSVLGVVGLVLLLTRAPGEHGDRRPESQPPAAASAVAAVATVATETTRSLALPATSAAADANVATTENAVAANPLQPGPPLVSTGGGVASQSATQHPMFHPAAKPGHTKTRVDDGF
jgi:serine/threonine protein kinase